MPREQRPRRKQIPSEDEFTDHLQMREPGKQTSIQENQRYHTE
jgi:hypothetical protein